MISVLKERKRRIKKSLGALLSIRLSAFSFEMLRLFLPVIIITLLYTLAYLLERGEYAGAYSYRVAYEILDRCFLSLTLLSVGTFLVEYKMKGQK